MEKNVAYASMAFLVLTCCSCLVGAQETIDVRSQQLDLKLQLLDSKLDLLDSKIKLWKSKPEELDIRLNEITRRIEALEFDPALLNSKFEEMDSAIREMKEARHSSGTSVTGLNELSLPEDYYVSYRSAIMMNPVRLFEGTFQLSYERLITDKFSVSIAGLATYATEKGMAEYFFENQAFAYYDNSSRTYINYKGESIAGGGIILQGQDYLLSDYPSRKKAPLGLYAAPQLLLRKIWINGERMEYTEDEWVTKEINRRLNVGSAGAVLGIKIPFIKVLFLDIFIGGNIRFSKYDGEAGLTKYKSWSNIDYSGVFPTAGISVGILK